MPLCERWCIRLNCLRIRHAQTDAFWVISKTTRSCIFQNCAIFCLRLFPNRYKLLFQSLILIHIKREHYEYLDVVTVDYVLVYLCIILFTLLPPLLKHLLIIKHGLVKEFIAAAFPKESSHHETNANANAYHTYVSFTYTTWNQHQSSADSVHLIVF